MPTPLQMYLGRFYLASSTIEVTISATAENFTIAAGWYYLDGGGDTQLLEAIKAQIDTHSMLAGDFFSPSLSVTTGLVTIETDGGTNFDLDWLTATSLRDTLGYAANLASDNVYVAPAKPKYVWLPTYGPSRSDVDTNQWWSQQSTGRVYVSKEGTTNAVSGNNIGKNSVAYLNLPQADVMTDSTTGNETFEEFFREVVSKSYEVRIVPDKTSYTTSADYETGLVSGEPGEPIGGYERYAFRTIEELDNLWTVILPFRKVV